MVRAGGRKRGGGEEANSLSALLPFKGTSGKLHIALPLWLKFSHMAITPGATTRKYCLLVGHQCTQLRIGVLITRKKGENGQRGIISFLYCSNHFYFQVLFCLLGN